MLAAFIAACGAYFGTQAAHGGYELAAARHVASGLATGLSAVHVQRNATRHHLDIVFA